MTLFRRASIFWQSRRFWGKARPRIALALGGGGVIGGMYEVGALAALEERLNGEGRGFDVYVGCSADRSSRRSSPTACGPATCTGSSIRTSTIP